MATVPRIVLDARPLSHPQAGGFRAYVRMLLRGIAERSAEGILDTHLILYCDRPLSQDVEATLPPNAEIRILSPSRVKTDLFLFARQVRRDRPTLVHGTSNYLPLNLGTPTTLTVHDAMGIKRYPWETQIKWTLRDSLMNRYTYLMTWGSVKKAHRIATVSQGAADEIASILKRPKEQFRVIYNGLDMPLPTRGITRQTRTLLMFHSPDARKNTECIYRALSEHRSVFGGEPPCLEIVCTAAKTAVRAEEAVTEHKITSYKLLRELDNQALSNTFAKATVFAWPSRLEGFGLPPLEAMQAGCPVISSSAPVMPEVLQDAPVYFNPDDPKELAERLNALLNDADAQERCRQRGKAIAAKYTSRRMADETVRFWLEAIGGKK